ALTAVRVDLPPGARARATARFSPDVPGPGEQTIGRCEPVAHTLRVAPGGGGTLRAPIRQPTPVCEHGPMTWTARTGVHGGLSPLLGDDDERFRADAERRSRRADGDARHLPAVVHARDAAERVRSRRVGAAGDRPLRPVPAGDQGSVRALPLRADGH